MVVLKMAPLYLIDIRLILIKILLLNEFKKIMIFFDVFIYFIVSRYTDGLRRLNYFQFGHKMVKLFAYLMLGFHLTAAAFTFL
jgi:hypothetical protein